MNTAEDTTEKSASILDILRQYVRPLPDGTTLDYVGVEQATGIRMDVVGRNALRRACRWEKRPYETVRDCGIRLSSADTAVSFAQKSDEVAKKSRRAQRFTQGLLTKHEEELRDSEKSTLLRTIGVLGSVRQALMHNAPILPAAEPKPDPSERTKGTLKLFRRTPPTPPKE